MISLLLALLPVQAPEDSTVEAEARSAAVLAEVVAEDDVLAAAFLVARGDRVELTGARGYFDAATRTAATVDTAIAVGGLDRALATLLLLQRIEDGELDPTRPLVKLFRELDELPRAVTLEHVLLDTSGLPALGALGLGGTPSTEVDRKTLLAALDDHALVFDPGERQDACDTNGALLVLLAEELAGRDLAKLADVEIAGPLGLRATGACAVELSDASTDEAPDAIPNDADDADAADEPDESPAHAEHPPGAFCASLGDLFLLQRALVERRLLQRAYETLVRTAPVPGATRGVLHAHDDLDGLEAHVLRGDLPARAVQLAYYPDADLTVAVAVVTDVTDIDGGEAFAERLQRNVARAFLDLPQEDASFEPPADLRHAMVGVYRSVEVTYRVWDEGGELTLELPEPDARRLPLLYRGSGRFELEGEPGARVRFVVDEARGAVTHLVLRHDDREVVALRTDDG